MPNRAGDAMAKSLYIHIVEYVKAREVQMSKARS